MRLIFILGRSARSATGRESAATPAASVERNVRRCMGETISERWRRMLRVRTRLRNLWTNGVELVLLARLEFAFLEAPGGSACCFSRRSRFSFTLQFVPIDE